MMTRKRKINRILMGAFAAAVLSLGAVSTAAPVQANNQDEIVERRPPKPKPAANPPVVTSTLLGLFLSGVVIFAGLMPVKRSNQD